MTATESQPAQPMPAVNPSMKNGNGVASLMDASQTIGLIFVRDYYTFLNKKPQRLHGFYDSDSLFIRGDEGEEAETYRGQEEIRKKIELLKFQDCKVLVTQVDSQRSANDGIIIQVLGEMCNMDGPSRKFSQTFFLAPQENGYYVLNDIFRFLKEEIDVDYYTCENEDQQEVPVSDPSGKTQVNQAEPSTPEAGLVTSSTEYKVACQEEAPVAEAQKPVAAQHSPTTEKPKVERKLDAKAEPKSEPKTELTIDTNSVVKGDIKTEQKVEPKSEPKHEGKQDTKKEPKPESKGDNKPDVKPESKTETKAEAKLETKTETKTDAKAEKADKAERHEPAHKHPAKQQQQHTVNNRQDDKPTRTNTPKTWANLAATESQKWGTHVAEAKAPIAAVPGPAKHQQQQQQQPIVQTQTNQHQPPPQPPQQPPQPQQLPDHQKQYHHHHHQTPSHAQTPHHHHHQQQQHQQQHQQQQNHGHGVHGHNHGQHQGHGPKDQRKESAIQIFVKNVGPQLTEDHLREAFLKFGTVKFVNIAHNRNCAFVEFTTPEACQKALAQHKVNIGNVVVLAEERRYIRHQYNRQQQNGRPFERRTQQDGQHRRGSSGAGGGGVSRGGGNAGGANMKRGGNTGGQM